MSCHLCSIRLQDKFISMIKCRYCTLCQTHVHRCKSVTFPALLHISLRRPQPYRTGIKWRSPRIRQVRFMHAGFFPRRPVHCIRLFRVIYNEFLVYFVAVCMGWRCTHTSTCTSDTYIFQFLPNPTGYVFYSVTNFMYDGDGILMNGDE